MIRRIVTIDAIARERQADAMFIAMLNASGKPTCHHPEISEATSRLTEEGIRREICGGFQRGGSLEGGPRVIFVDAHYAPGSRTLEKLEARFEREDGTDAVPWSGVAGADRHRDARRGPA